MGYHIGGLASDWVTPILSLILREPPVVGRCSDVGAAGGARTILTKSICFWGLERGTAAAWRAGSVVWVCVSCEPNFLWGNRAACAGAEAAAARAPGGW